MQRLTNMQSDGARQCLGLAGGRAPPLRYFLIAQEVHLRLVEGHPLSSHRCGSAGEQEGNIYFSHAGGTRHTSGEYLNCSSFLFSSSSSFCCLFLSEKHHLTHVKTCNDDHWITIVCLCVCLKLH